MNTGPSSQRRAMVKRPVDDTDRRIIAALRVAPRSTNKEIARKVRVSEATVSSRIDALVDDRLIKITVQRDVRTLGLKILAHVELDVDGARLEAIARELGEFEQVFAVTVVVGNPQIVLLVFARDTLDLDRFVREEIARVSGVRQASVALALRTTKVDPAVAAL